LAVIAVFLAAVAVASAAVAVSKAAYISASPVVCSVTAAFNWVMIVFYAVIFKF
jgi:hypothetical protein